MRGCPLIKLRRYRDRIVLLAASLTELDGRDISPTERIFLENFYSRQIGGQPVAHFPGSSSSDMNRSAISSVTSAGQYVTRVHQRIFFAFFAFPRMHFCNILLRYSANGGNFTPNQGFFAEQQDAEQYERDSAAAAARAEFASAMAEAGEVYEDDDDVVVQSHVSAAPQTFDIVENSNHAADSPHAPVEVMEVASSDVDDDAAAAAAAAAAAGPRPMTATMSFSVDDGSAAVDASADDSTGNSMLPAADQAEASETSSQDARATSGDGNGASDGAAADAADGAADGAAADAADGAADGAAAVALPDASEITPIEITDGATAPAVDGDSAVADGSAVQHVDAPAAADGAAAAADGGTVEEAALAAAAHADVADSSAAGSTVAAEE